MVKQYELMVLLPAESTQDQVKAFIQTIEKLVVAKKGSVNSSELLGKRQLAYQIKKQREAYYVLFRITLDTEFTQAFEREVKLLDIVLRSLLIIFDEKKSAQASEHVSDTVIEEVKSEE